MPSLEPLNDKEADTFTCQVAAMQLVTDTMWHVQLLLPEGQKADFWPGQHLLLDIDFDDGSNEQIPFSIAAAPASIMGGDPRQLELYIASATTKAQQIISYLRTHSAVKVTLPMGECFLNPSFLQEHSGQPLLMIAAGSGFSQIKSLTEAALKLNAEQEIHIYWSNKQADDFYLPELMQQWQQDYPHVRTHFILEEGAAEWQGREGWIYQVLAADFNDLSRTQVFACGSPKMVYGTLDRLAHLGLSEQNLHSDVFTYAPRDEIEHENEL